MEIHAQKLFHTAMPNFSYRFQSQNDHTFIVYLLHSQYGAKHQKGKIIRYNLSIHSGMHNLLKAKHIGESNIIKMAT